MNNRFLQSVFAAMRQTAWEPAERNMTDEKISALVNRQEQQTDAIARSRAIIAACGPQEVTRQVCRRAESQRTFAALSEQYHMPRKIRRAITRDKLKIDRTAAKR